MEKRYIISKIVRINGHVTNREFVATGTAEEIIEKGAQLYQYFKSSGYAMKLTCDGNAFTATNRFDSQSVKVFVVASEISGSAIGVDNYCVVKVHMKNGAKVSREIVFEGERDKAVEFVDGEQGRFKNLPELKIDRVKYEDNTRGGMSVRFKTAKGTVNKIMYLLQTAEHAHAAA